MNVVKNRILNTLNLLKGPYRKRSSVEVLLTIQSGLNQTETQKLSLDSMHSGLPFAMKSASGKLFFQLPKTSVLKKATFLGWETFWNGLTQGSVEYQDNKTLEIAIPADGWWRISTHSLVMDVLTVVGSQEEQSLSLGSSLKSFLLGKPIRIAFLALTLHLGLLYFAANLSFVLDKFKSIVFHTESQPIEEAASAPPVAVLSQEAIENEAAFHGRSIFAAIHQDKEKNFKAQDLTAGVKNLAKLLNKPMKGLPQVKVNTGAQGNSNSTAAMKSLQTGLVGKAGGAGSGVAKANSGMRDVRWNSDFQVNNGSKKGGLSEGQQQALFKIFAGYQDKFRGCYESALLKFDEMTVTVSFEAVIGPDGTVGKPLLSVSGRSTPESQEVLTRCLKNVMTQIKVDKKMSGIKIKNQFIFKS